jgi:integrase
LEGETEDVPPNSAKTLPVSITSTHTFAEWAREWLRSYRPPMVSRRTHQNYGYITNTLCRHVGPLPLSAVGRGRVLDLRADLEREGKSHRTVGDVLAVLRLILRDARERGLIQESPLDQPLPRRSTKAIRASRARRVRFRPFIAAELEILLDVLREPRNLTEALYFPPTEFMVLTGLRWGEAVGLTWADVSRDGGWIHVQRAVVRGEDDRNEPTKTGNSWSIPLREPLADLLHHQRGRSHSSRLEDRVFANALGQPIDYHAWRRRGWNVALERARVTPREGDAQKACRRTYAPTGASQMAPTP